jgi:hypothetical protein
MDADAVPQIVRRIPWQLVRSIEPGVVRIATTMGELGFGTGHHAAARRVAELDRGAFRLSSLLGARVEAPDGRPLGRVHDVRAQLDGTPQSPRGLRVTGLLLGSDGWKQRLIGSARGRRGHPRPTPASGPGTRSSGPPATPPAR